MVVTERVDPPFAPLNRGTAEMQAVLGPWGENARVFDAVMKPAGGQHVQAASFRRVERDTVHRGWIAHDVRHPRVLRLAVRPAVPLDQLAERLLEGSGVVRRACPAVAAPRDDPDVDALKKMRIGVDVVGAGGREVAGLGGVPLPRRRLHAFTLTRARPGTGPVPAPRRARRLVDADPALNLSLQFLGVEAIRPVLVPPHGDAPGEPKRPLRVKRRRSHDADVSLDRHHHGVTRVRDPDVRGLRGSPGDFVAPRRPDPFVRFDHVGI